MGDQTLASKWDRLRVWLREQLAGDRSEWSRDARLIADVLLMVLDRMDWEEQQRP